MNTKSIAPKMLEPSTGYHRLLLVAILVLAGAFRLTGVWFGYPWLTQPDEGNQYVSPALTILDFANSHGLAPVTHNGPLSKYWLAFVYGLWGLLAQLFIPLDRLISLWRETTQAYIIGRVVLGVIPGVAAVGVMYLVARRLLGPLAGLVAAFLLSLAFKAVEYGHYATSDSLVLFFLGLIVFFSIKYFDTNRPKYLYWAAVFWAAGAAVKFSLLPTVLIPLAAVFSCSVSGISHRCLRAGKMVALAFVVLLFLHLPYFFQIQEFYRMLTDTFLLENKFIKGFFWYFRPDIYPNSQVPTAGVGWWLLSVCLVGMIVVWLKLPRYRWILFLFPVIYYPVLGSASTKEMRYFLPLLWFFCLWGGLFFIWLAERLQRRWKPSRSWVVVVVLLLVFTGPNLYHDVIFIALAADGNTELETYQSLFQRVNPSDTWGVLFFSSPARNVSHGLEVPFNWSSDTYGSHRSPAKGLGRLLNPDSLLATKAIQYIAIDYLWIEALRTTPVTAIAFPEERQNILACVDLIQTKWPVIQRFEPRYRQTWGEGSISGRQAVCVLYRNPDLEP